VHRPAGDVHPAAHAGSVEHPEAQRKIPEAALRLQRALSSTLFLDPNPKEMRSYAYADEHALRGDGRNVSSTLKFLCDRGDKEAILTFVRKLPSRTSRISAS